MNKFLNLLQFLTRITVSKKLKYNEEMGSAMVYFPVVGIVIGSILIAVYGVMNILLTRKFHIMEASAIVLLEAIITGGLHIDGFGDTFDGLFSYRSKERVLEIMKDPTMGTNGILAIVFLIIFKIAALYISIENSMYWTIFAMPVAGRLTPVVMSYKAVSARKNGMGELFIGKCSGGNLAGAVIISGVTVFVSSIMENREAVDSLIYAAVIIIIIIYALLFRRSVYKQIDGITGDILGCSTEMGELIFIIYTVLISQIM